MTGVFGPENYCHSCGVNCDNGWTFGPCVRDRGPAISLFGIKDWKEEDKISLQENLYKIGFATEKYIVDNRVNLGCYTPQGGENLVDPGPAAAKALDILCNLNTDNITIGNILSCLGSNSSVYSRMLGTRYANIQLNSLSTGGSVGYNLTDLVDNLPLGFTMTNLKVEMFTQNPGNVYDSRIGTHKQTTGQFILAADQFPANMEISMDIGTPGGLVTLYRKIPISSQKNESFHAIMDMEDRTSTKGAGMSQSEFNILVESAYCNIRNLVDTLRTVGVSGCDDMKHTSKDIRDVVSVHDGNICTIYSRLNNIGKESVKGTLCDKNCAERTFDITLQEWITKVDEDRCTMQTQIAKLISDNQELNQRLTICCEGKNASEAASTSTGVNNSIGNTSGTTNSSSSSGSSNSNSGSSGSNSSNSSGSNGSNSNGSNSNGSNSNGSGSNNSGDLSGNGNNGGTGHDANNPNGGDGSQVVNNP